MNPYGMSVVSICWRGRFSRVSSSEIYQFVYYNVEHHLPTVYRKSLLATSVMITLPMKNVISNTLTTLSRPECSKLFLLCSFQMQSLSPYDLNNTRKAGTQILFFNRVPKVMYDRARI